MANRNLRYDSLILRSRDLGSGDRILSLLTVQEGTMDVFLFGGGRSRLAALASPYVTGTAFVYVDSSKNYRTLSDFAVSGSNAGLRESLGRLLGAAVVSDLMLTTHAAGGEFARAYELASSTLELISRTGEEDMDYPILVFLWRSLILMGLAPCLDSCVSCGSPALSRDFARSPALMAKLSGTQSHAPPDWPLYLPAREGLFCADCARSAVGQGAARGGEPDAEQGTGRKEESGLRLSPGLLRWLLASGAGAGSAAYGGSGSASHGRAGSVPGSAAHAGASTRSGASGNLPQILQLDRQTLDLARSFLVYLARVSIDTPLRSLEQYLRNH